jgi:hypothetical protein
VVRGDLWVGSASVAKPIGPFMALDAVDAVELGELLALLSDWMASDPNRLDASLHDFLGVPDYVGPVSTVDELRADVGRFAEYCWAMTRRPANYLARLHPGREGVSSLAAGD